MRLQSGFLNYSCKLVALILLVGSTATVLGQAKPTNSITVQKITLKDKVLERNLSSYCSQVSYKAILVKVRKYDNAYSYSLSGISFSEHINWYPTPFWGIWQNRLLVVYAGPEARALVSLQDSTGFANLLPYAQSLLPSTHGDLIFIHGLEWEFEVEKGRETWLWTSDGYDSRDIPVMDDPKWNRQD